MRSRSRGKVVVVAVATLGVAAGAGWARPGPLPAAEIEDTRANSLGMTLVRIPAGEFVMGSSEGEEGHVPNEAPPHRVRITRPFEIGAHEVTNAQFQAFVEATGYLTEAERDVGGGSGSTSSEPRWCRTLATPGGTRASPVSTPARSIPCS